MSSADNEAVQGVGSQRPGKEVDWLNSKERKMVESAVRFRVEDKALSELLPVIANNFSPTECADILHTVFKKIAEDPTFKQGITTWVQDFQSGTLAVEQEQIHKK